jgi:hypothetical protein
VAGGVWCPFPKAAQTIVPIGEYQLVFCVIAIFWTSCYRHA